MNFKGELIKAGVIRKGHFHMEDGRHTDTWIDVDRLVLSIIENPVESWKPDECPMCQPICPGCNGIGFPFDDAEDKCCMCNGTGKLSVIPLTNPKKEEIT